MKSLEERIWDYIDGQAPAAEKTALEQLFTTDPAVKKLYQQLLEVNHQLANMDLDEPSMGFTRNVMERVALEVKPVVLKTKIDLRIISIVGGFFLLSITVIFLFAFFEGSDIDNTQIPVVTFSTDLSNLFNPTALKIFLFVDLFIALLYIDSVFRRKLNAQKKETAL